MHLINMKGNVFMNFFNTIWLKLMEFFTWFSFEFERTFITENRWKMFLDGIEVTLLLSLFSIIFGLILGILLAFGKLSKVKILRWICNAWIDIIRGTPSMVQVRINQHRPKNRCGNSLWYKLECICCGNYPRRYTFHQQRAN